MKKWILALLLFVCLCTGGCGTESVRTDDYEYLIGVSLTNVMEPWLNNLAQVIGSRAETEKNVNLIFRDAAGSTEKQIQDIESLMKCGIDLLIVSPDGSNALNGIMEEVFEEIPIVAVSYTHLQAQDVRSFLNVWQVCTMEIPEEKSSLRAGR